MCSRSRSFFVTKENGEQQDLNNLTTMPCVQRSLCLDEEIDDSSSAQVQFPKGVRGQMRGFQDKQKDYQQTDSLASTRPGFRMSCQMAASRSWDLFHIDLKTAFLQGQSCDVNRDVVCQLPPEAGLPPYCCQTEETCIWHERCSPTPVGNS